VRGFRITSRFSKNRLHPILRIRRPHYGIDYAAPIGTPVESVGDGIVKFKGWKGGFGNYVEISHPNNFVTCYGHLRDFAKGIAVGAKVRQGQTIGYIGSSGLSTGPHLDFRIRQGNTYFDFLNNKNRSSASRQISPEKRAEFNKIKEEYINILEEKLQNGEKL
jgi:murein DD-endopeptidase MepM/ murein hydrolase activator NlpD